MRRLLRALSNVLVVTGVLLVADAVLTVVWQEPVTAIYGKINQGRLGDELSELEQAPLSPVEQRALREIRAEGARIEFLARSMRRRLRDGEALGRIEIPKIGARYVVVEGTDAASLRKGPGHYPDTPLPGMRGTVAVAGHRTTYLAPFNDLDELRQGDVVRIEMPYAVVGYRVERKQIVEPTALWVTRRVDHDRLVLTACHPKYSAAKRIVVFARQVSERLRPVSARSR